MRKTPLAGFTHELQRVAERASSGVKREDETSSSPSKLARVQDSGGHAPPTTVVLDKLMFYCSTAGDTPILLHEQDHVKVVVTRLNWEFELEKKHLEVSVGEITSFCYIPFPGDTKKALGRIELDYGKRLNAQDYVSTRKSEKMSAIAFFFKTAALPQIVPGAGASKCGQPLTMDNLIYKAAMNSWGPKRPTSLADVVQDPRSSGLFRVPNAQQPRQATPSQASSTSSKTRPTSALRPALLHKPPMSLLKQSQQPLPKPASNVPPAGRPPSQLAAAPHAPPKTSRHFGSLAAAPPPCAVPRRQPLPRAAHLSEKVRRRRRSRTHVPLVQDRGVLLFSYPLTAQRDTVSIRRADVAKLCRGEYLNDSVVDFYLKYLLERDAPAKSLVHIFSSFLMSRLAHRLITKRRCVPAGGAAAGLTCA
jgi:hypothetical protein